MSTPKRRRVLLILAAAVCMTVVGCFIGVGYMQEHRRFSKALVEITNLTHPDELLVKQNVFLAKRSRRLKIAGAFRTYERWTGEPHPDADMELDVPVVTQHLRDVCSGDMDAISFTLATAVTIRRGCLDESAALSGILALGADSIPDIVCAAACVDAVYDAPIPMTYDCGDDP